MIAGMKLDLLLILAEAAEPDFKKLKTEVVVGAAEPDGGQYPVVISDGLAKFFGSEEKKMPETEAFRRLWDYIKANQLEVSVICNGYAFFWILL